MADEPTGTTIKTDSTGTTVTTAESPESVSIREYILYKLDRTIAVVGIVVIAIAALYLGKTPDNMNIVSAAIGGLVVYVSGRSGK